MTPRAQGGGGRVTPMNSDPTRPGGPMAGPFSMNQWQMNRTANLVVRNVPGSNIFMSAAGMVG
jgi:hypothetical protein